MIIVHIQAFGSKPFNAGVVIEGEKVVKAAPILKYMVGWDYEFVLRYARGRGWETEVSWA